MFRAEVLARPFSNSGQRFRLLIYAELIPLIPVPNVTRIQPCGRNVHIGSVPAAVSHSAVASWMEGGGRRGHAVPAQNEKGVFFEP